MRNSRIVSFALVFALLLVQKSQTAVAQAPSLSGSTACTGSLLAVTSSVTPTQIIWNLGGLGISTVTATIAASGTTVAGIGGGGTAANQLNSPSGVWIDGSGNMYIADVANNRIQKWAAGATSGVTVAGGGFSGAGPAQLNFPADVRLDGGGNMYIADEFNNRVQKWAPGASVGTTVAGTGVVGSGPTQLHFPTGVFVDAGGNIYVADHFNARVQKWATGATAGTTVAGTGTAGSGATQLNGPNEVWVDASGNLFVADEANNRIQKWAAGATAGTTVAGTGVGGIAATQLSNPECVFVDASGNMYVADRSNSRIQKWAAGATTGVTIAGGSMGSGATQFNGVYGVHVDGNGNVFVADANNNRIQEFVASITNTLTTTVAGNYNAVVFTEAGNTTGTNTVTINALPAIGINITSIPVIYQGGSGIALTASGGQTYIWSPASGLSATTGANVTANPTIATTYTVSGTGSNGCSNTASMMVSVDAMPSLSGTTPCTGSLLTLASAIQPTQIVWQLGGSGISTVTASINAAATTIAGTGGVGSSAMQLHNPFGVFVDGSANIYIADWGNNRIQKWAAGATAGTTVAGTGTSGSSSAQLNVPSGVYVDGSGNIYVADQFNNRVQKWAAGASVGTTVAGTGTAGAAATQLFDPLGVYVDGGGNVYVADNNNSRIQKWAPGATVGTTVAGTGVAGSGATQLNNAASVFVDVAGNMYVTDRINSRIQEWAAGATAGTTVAGITGTGGSGATQLSNPYDVFVDGSGNIYVADAANSRIQKWAAGATTGTTVAGTGVAGSGATQLNNPTGVYVDGSGNVYVADNNNSRIQKWGVGATAGVTVAGSKPDDPIALSSPSGIYVDGGGNTYVTDNGNNRIQKWAPGATAGTTVAGTGVSGSGASQLHSPNGVYVDGSGNIYVAEINNNRVQKWAAGATAGTTVAGTGVSGSGVTQLSAPYDVFVDGNGNIYVADAGNNRIQKWAAGATAGTRVAGTGVSGSGATQLSLPNSVYVDGGGNIYVSDWLNNRVQKWAAGATTGTMVAGTGISGSGASQLNTPQRVYVDGSGSIYVADNNNNRIQKWAAGATAGITVAGTGTLGSGGVQLANPAGVYVDGSGNIYVADAGNNRIQEFPATITTTLTATNTGNYNAIVTTGAGTTTTSTITVNAFPVVSGGNNVSVYNGSSTTLNAAGATIYTWSPATALSATTGASVNANPVSTTTYTITGTTSGCSSNAMVTVSVDALPALAGSTVCIGSQLTVTSSSAQPAQIVWQIGGVGISTVTTTIAAGGIEVAGSGTVPGTGNSQLSAPFGVFKDGSGSIYVADNSNHRIQRWAAGATSGVMVAGTGLAGAGATQLNAPTSVFVDASGNMYVADQNNNRIQKWMQGATSGVSVAGTGAVGVGAAQLSAPTGVCVDGSGSIYIADQSNNRIQKWAAGATFGTTVAGTGIAGPGATQLHDPLAVCVDASGNLFVADYFNNRIQKWAPGATTGITVAGSGTPGTGASQLTMPSGVCVDPYGNIYVGDYGNNRIQKWAVGASSGVTVAGSSVGSSGASASLLSGPVGVFVDAVGNIDVADYANNRIQEFAPSVIMTVTATTGGIYSALITTAAGNVTTNTVTVNATPTVGTAGGGIALCSGATATLSGTGAGSYSWTGGITNGVAFSPAVGTNTYTVTGTSNGCSNTATTTLTVNALPTVGGTGGGISICSGGSATLNGTGASSYSWTGGVTNGSVFTPSVGVNIYTVNGTDANSCSNKATTTITVNALPTVSSTGGGLSICAGVTAILSGTGASSYSWTGGIIDGGIFTPGVGINAYTVTGTDANSCSNTAATTITVNAIPTVGATGGSIAICSGTSALLNGTGASSYSWTGGITDGVSFTPSVGVHTYTVTGTTSGCSNTAITTVTVNAIPTVGTAGGGVAICNGTAAALNGTGAISYSWTGGVTDGASFTPSIGINNYTVTGTDVNSCSNIATTTITVNALPTVGSTGGGIAVCAGASATLSGTGAASYSWTGGITDGVSFTPAVGVNTYTVTGTTNGCSNTATATITVNAIPTVGSSGGSIAICAGASATLSGTGATSYSWTNGVTDATTFTPGAGTNTYTVTGTTAGCSNTAVATITVNALPTVGSTGGGIAICAGAAVTLNGTGASFYSWTGGITDGTPFTPATGINTYTVTGTTAGCSNTAVATITVNALPTVGSTGGGIAICAGAAVTLNGTGASFYSWTGGITDGTPFTPATGIKTYTVTGTTAGCSNTATTTITVNALPTVGSTGGGIAICAGAAVTLNGTGAASYSWTGGVTNGASFTPAVGINVYTVTGTTAGCSNSATVTITVNALPIVGATGGGVVICSGTTATLSGTGASSYAWTGGITNGVPFTPAGGTHSYTVTGTTGACSNTATATITVNTVSAGSITGLSTVAVGANITLTDATTGGTWTASNGNATVTAGLVHGVTAGTVNISYAVTSSGCTAAATKLVTVGTSTTTTTVAAITGFYFYLCIGATAPFFDATAGGVWSINPADAGVASVSATGVVSGISAGAARLSYTVGSSFATAVLNIYPVPAAISGTASLCQAATTTLSDATPGGVWSSAIPATATIGTSGIVSGTNAGTVSIYYTLVAPGGCKAAIVVTINPNPAPVTGPTKVCTGTSIALTDATTGGVWSGTNTYATVGGAGSIAGLSAGSTVVTYTSVLGCFKAYPVTVNQSPLPIGGILTVCTGAKTFLSDLSTPGVSWTSNTTSVAPITASGAVSGMTPGTATITYTLADMCTTTAIVTVNPTPAITAILGAASVSHSGSGIILSDLTGGGLWSSSNTAILTVGSATGHVTAMVSAGSANINYTVTNGFGCAATATKLISTSPAPPAHYGTTTTTIGMTVSLADEAATGEWTSSDNGIATVDGNGMVTAMATGNADIIHTITNNNGAVSTTITQLIVNPLPEVHLIPNPNHGAFTIHGTTGSDKDETVTLEVTNMLGQSVYRNNITATTGIINEQVTLSNNLPNGMYLLNVTSGNQNKVLHFVLEK